MIPTTLSLLGSGVRWSTVGFIGWFGPRGLASLIFALLATSEQSFTGSDTILNTVIITASFSVLLHGLTAAPGAKWYGAAIHQPPCKGSCEHQDVPELPIP